MKRLILFCLFLYVLPSNAQKKHGINWMQGGYYTNKIHFKNITPFITPFVTGIYFGEGSSCISDTGVPTFEWTN